jgi:hypothetical protein
MDWTAIQLDQCARRTRRRRARLTIIAVLVGATALAAGVLVARAADPGIEDECPYNSKLVYDDPGCKPKPAPVRFQPWQQSWQCNDLRVTVTGQNPDTINYDIGGTVWGGINFSVWRGQLYLRGVPCAPLR